MITSHPFLTRRPQRPSKMPACGVDPVRHFIARYALQAVIDYYWPDKDISPADWRTAKGFVLSTDGQYIIRELGIPITKIRRILGEVPR